MVIRLNNGAACAGVFLALLVAATPARALTGADVLDKMNEDESTGYLSGSVAMAAFLSGVQGNRTRSQCIVDWYFEKSGPQQIVQALDHYKDREALPVIYALIKRACGE